MSTTEHTEYTERRQGRRREERRWLTFLLFLSCVPCVPWFSSSASAADSPTVGMPARLTVVLPGPELEARPIDSREAPLVLRIIRVEPAEDGYRYEVEYTGLVPGRFDLRDYLRRKDRSPVTRLPSVHVTVQSVLPPGQA